MCSDVRRIGFVFQAAMLVLTTGVTRTRFIAANVCDAEVGAVWVYRVIGFVLRCCLGSGAGGLGGSQILEAFVECSFRAIAGGGDAS